jgi:hypothetical protein
MATASPVFYESFTEDLAESVFPSWEGSTTLTIALTNTAPNVATHHQLSDVTEIVYTNLGASSRVLTSVTAVEASGTTTVDATGVTLTATGTVPTFRYVVLYDNAAPNDELICYYDYGSAVDLSNTETFDFTVSTNLFTIGTA